jgi:rhodanese-related sulfurtransferase
MTTWKRYLILMLSFAVAACAGQSAADDVTVGTPIEVTGGTYTDISVAELQAMLENKDFVFVNVHIPFEGDIAGTDLSIPYNEIEANLGLLPAERDAKIVLYCRSDRMSTIAAEVLVGLGYTNIYNLDGGMVAWEAAGLDLEGK